MSLKAQLAHTQRELERARAGIVGRLSAATAGHRAVNVCSYPSGSPPASLWPQTVKCFPTCVLVALCRHLCAAPQPQPRTKLHLSKPLPTNLHTDTRDCAQLHPQAFLHAFLAPQTGAPGPPRGLPWTQRNASGWRRRPPLHGRTRVGTGRCWPPPSARRRRGSARWTRRSCGASGWRRRLVPKDVCRWCPGERQQPHASRVHGLATWGTCAVHRCR